MHLYIEHICILRIVTVCWSDIYLGIHACVLQVKYLIPVKSYLPMYLYIEHVYIFLLWE
jgi:hypothetical protein